MKSLKLLLVVLLGAALLCGCSTGGTTNPPGSAENNGSGSENGNKTSSTSEKVDQLLLNANRNRGGSFTLDDIIPEMQDIGTEEANELDRAVRAFDGRAKSNLLINNAKEFYYYEQLDTETQKLYDAMLTLCEEPDDEDSIVVLKTKMDVKDKDFEDAYSLAYLALCYDHPELFWLYNAIKTDIKLYSFPNISGSSSNGYTDVYLELTKPYPDFQKDMKKFNDAAAAFLKDIDLKADEEEIALQIHDKLTELVTYDMDVFEDLGNSRANLAHTAYGALVCNNAGKANYAVCDGYSLAYTYLCQQAGLNATVILGNAGSTAADAGGHAWSIVEIDGDWYELDSTWDDTEYLDELVVMLESDEYKNDETAQYVLEAINDDDYRDTLGHYLYMITTKEMTAFKPDDSHRYKSKDGMVSLSLVDPSVHIRFSDTATSYYKGLMELAPVAY